MAKELDLQKYLAEARRISEHRTKGAEEEIRIIFKELLKDLVSFIGEEYAKYNADELTYDIMQEKGRYARFIEEVVTKVDKHSPQIINKVKGVCNDIYTLNYKYMTKAVMGVTGFDIGYSNVTPEVAKASVQNPVDGLTLDDTLEKNRLDIIYKIKKNVSIGLTQGDRNDTMAKRLQESVDFSYNKSIRIVRTETHRVIEKGQLDSALDIHKIAQEKDLGFKNVKIWRNMGDELVRPKYVRKTSKGYKRGISKFTKANHIKMEGQTVDVDEKFNLGNGVYATTPGNSGDASNDINCRCYAEYKIVFEDKNANKIDEVKNLYESKKDRADLAKELLKLYKIPIAFYIENLKGSHGCVSYQVIGDDVHTISMKLNKDEKRIDDYQKKTVFHELFHARANGLKTDRYSKMKERAWVDIEETFAETNSLYMAKQVGIKTKIMPSYPEKLVKMIPKLKQLEEFKHCKTLEDFGEVAHNIRFGENATAEFNYIDERLKKIKATIYDKKEYIDYIGNNRGIIVDKIIESAPNNAEHKDYIRELLDDIVDKNLSYKEGDKFVYDRAIAWCMKELGV